MQHVVAYYLSLIELGELGDGVQDDFLESAQLFKVDILNSMEIDDEPANLWLTNMISFLGTRLPPKQMSLENRKRLVVRRRNFYLLEDTLYHKRADGIWRRCFQKFEKELVLREAPCGVVGGHYAGQKMSRKIWNSVLWWPTTMKDAVNYCRQCDLCQQVGHPNDKDQMPPQPVLPPK